VLIEQGKFGAKIFSHYTDIVIFVLGHFNLKHPVLSCTFCWIATPLAHTCNPFMTAPSHHIRGSKSEHNSSYTFLLG